MVKFIKYMAGAALTIAWGSGAFAATQTPAPPQQAPIALVNGDIYTVSGDVIAKGQILFDRGKIVAVGKEITIPDNAKRIDVAGKRVYPGLFAAGSDLGLAEIRSVPGSMDVTEPGSLNPNARSEVAVNPDSELIPVARANGLLLNLTIPTGQLLAGSSAVLQLDGWTWEDLTLKAPAAMHLTWPSTAGRGRRSTQTPEESAPPEDTQVKAIEQAFDDARAYMAAKKGATSDRQSEFDARWEAMIPLLEGRIPLIVRADQLKQIMAAVALAEREKVKLIIHGGYDAPHCAALLKKHDIPVIVNGVQRLPLRADAPYDEPFTLAGRLHEAGIRFCISQFARFGASDLRNLPYHAGTAAAHGLPREEALKAITLYPARILGVENRVGSLEAGKDATLFVASGDILETPTSVELAFVQGRQIDLSSRHTQLWKKYQEKYRQNGNGKVLAGE